MKILVMSDSHNDYETVLSVVGANLDADMILHCGDGAAEIEKLRHAFPDKKVIGVRGNCDLITQLPESEIIEAQGKKMFINHGANYGVKYSLASLLCKAREVGANIVIYGHTHVPMCDVRGGVYVMNPGSIRGEYGTYGVINIEDNQAVEMNIASVKDLQKA